MNTEPLRPMRLAWCACLVGLVGTPALGQTPRELPAFELEHLTFNPAQRAGLLLGTGDLLPEQQLRVALIVDYQHDPLVLREDGLRVGSVVKSRLTAHLVAAYGITRWLEVGLQIPVVVFQAGDSLASIAAPAGAGLGTPWLQARLGLLAQEREQPIDLGFQVGVGFPIGSSGALARDGTVGFSPRVGVGRSFGLLRAGLEVGALFRGAQRLSPASTSPNDEIGSLLQLGASLTTTNQGLRGELTALGWIPFTHSQGSVEILAGARYPLGPIELFALGGPGVGTMPGTPAFRVMLGAGLSWPDRRCVEGTPYQPKDCPALDLDHDGVINEQDQCVSEPGPAELFGCPDTDADGDGVLNLADRCPKVKGLAALAGCPDTDGDGLADPDDQCPAKAGPKENKGCPWPDTDGDGLVDRDDGCPAVAGPKENKGCPWPDTDGDGVLDKDDACPTESGPPDRKGCPIKDTDGDGVPDELDNCPKVKGPASNQGCPKEDVQLVIITREKLVIKNKVFFDTGKATIKNQSFKMLTQVGQILVDHEEIKRVSIEGHTDNTGKAEVNRVLSQKRSESVRDFLIKYGVAAGRLEAKGFGPDRPAGSNLTAAGKEANRRVEFVVVPEVTP